MQPVEAWLQLNTSDALANQWVETVLAVTALLVLRWLLLTLIGRRKRSAEATYWGVKVINYTSGLVVVLAMGWIWRDDVKGLLTFLGLLTAGIAIALRDPVLSLIAWFYILFRRTFEVGDRIEIEGHVGDVIDISLFQFTLLEVGNWVSGEQTSGRILHVPNNKVFSAVFANYTDEFPYVWHEMQVVVPVDSNWQKAKTMLMEILARRAGTVAAEAEAWAQQPGNHRFLVVYGTLTPIVYTRVEPDGVHLTLRYLSMVRRRRDTESEIWEDILSAFAAESDITFA